MNNNTTTTNENIEQSMVKSIIYGNIITTNYGILRVLCSAINSKDHIDKIILYVKNNVNFQKYNKYIYSFRLEHHNSDLFITNNQNNNHQKEKYIQGYDDCKNFQGCGMKLLCMLQKFNVRNVLVIVVIKQYDPLRQFHAQHYVHIVKCAKDLLSSLYDKVMIARIDNVDTIELQQQQKRNEKVILPIKQFNIPIKKYKKIQKIQQNINYVGIKYIKKLPIEIINKHKTQIKYLNKKIRQLAGILEEIINGFGQNQNSQVKFTIQYDRNKNVIKTFDLLAKIFGFSSKQIFLKGNMSDYLKSITSRNLTSDTIRNINQILMSHQALKSNRLAEQSVICGILMQFVQILLKSYSFARRLAIIESQIEENNDKIESS